MEAGQTNSGKIERWYDLTGPVDAPPVVLLHGSVVTRAAWKPQIESLCASYRLIVPDLPAHGALARVPFRLNDAVDRIQLLVQQECRPDERVALVGMSLGGHVATLTAARLQEQAAGLVISGASMNFHGLTGWWTRLVGRLMLGMKEEKARAQAAANIRRKWPREMGEEIITAGLYPRGAFEPFRELPDVDFRAKLSQITAPVLILNGEKDRPNRRGEQSFARATRNARVEVIPGAGHACSIEQPEAYNRVLVKFLAALRFTGPS